MEEPFTCDRCGQNIIAEAGTCTDCYHKGANNHEYVTAEHKELKRRLAGLVEAAEAALDSLFEQCEDSKARDRGLELKAAIAEAVECALADLEGIMPEYEPSGDRIHHGWQTIQDLQAALGAAKSAYNNIISHTERG